MLNPNFVCKLDMALYGTKQSPRAWYCRLSTKLLQLNFKPSKAGSLLFYYHKGDVSLFVLVYEDIVVASSSKNATKALLKDLEKEFALKDLGDLHYFSRINVKKKGHGLILNQEKYVDDILKRTGMARCAQTDTPLSTSEILGHNR
jgi:hypothetical protein